MGRPLEPTAAVGPMFKAGLVQWFTFSSAARGVPVTGSARRGCQLEPIINEAGHLALLRPVRNTISATIDAHDRDITDANAITTVKDAVEVVR